MMPGGMAKKEYVALYHGESVVWKLAMHVGGAFCERGQVDVVLDQLNSNVGEKTLCLVGLGLFEGLCRVVCGFWQGWERARV